MDVFRYKLSELSKCPVKNLACMFIIIFVCAFIHICLMREIGRFVDDVSSLRSLSRDEPSPSTKYILMWNKCYLVQDNGRNIFEGLNCSVSNCMFSANKNHLKDYTDFDAILFDEHHLVTKERPTRRKTAQIYIFSTLESSVNYPACELYNDEYFNWTFTFRLDSDVVWNYFVVRNATGHIVAPSGDAKWVTNTIPVSPKIRSIFKGRLKAAAWIVSNCNAYSLRQEYLTRLQEHLLRYSLTIDVFGMCTKDCDNNNCDEMLRNKYFFYMAFENSLAVDYVTEKVLHGYNNYVVPIVFGGANYSRFLPPGSYINAREHHPFNLAFLIDRAVSNPATYAAYFHWTHLYTIDSDPSVYHPLCDLCEALHTSRSTHAPAKKNFRYWWNTMNGMKWCLSKDFWNESAKLNIDATSLYS